MELDHYLEVLIRKPGALPGATALEQARAAGQVHARSTTPGGPRPARPTATRDGTRALIEVLLLHRHMAHEHVVAGLAAALAVGALTADAVALEARKAAQTQQAGQPEPVPDRAVLLRQGGNVTSLTERRLRTSSRPTPGRCRP